MWELAIHRSHESQRSVNPRLHHTLTLEVMAVTILYLLFLFELEVTILGQDYVAGEDILI